MLKHDRILTFKVFNRKETGTLGNESGLIKYLIRLTVFLIIYHKLHYLKNIKLFIVT